MLNAGQQYKGKTEIGIHGGALILEGDSLFEDDFVLVCAAARAGCVVGSTGR